MWKKWNFVIFLPKKVILFFYVYRRWKRPFFTACKSKKWEKPVLLVFFEHRKKGGPVFHEDFIFKNPIGRWKKNVFFLNPAWYTQKVTKNTFFSKNRRKILFFGQKKATFCVYQAGFRKKHEKTRNLPKFPKVKLGRFALVLFLCFFKKKWKKRDFFVFFCSNFVFFQKNPWFWKYLNSRRKLFLRVFCEKWPRAGGQKRPFFSKYGDLKKECFFAKKVTFLWKNTFFLWKIDHTY